MRMSLNQFNALTALLKEHGVTEFNLSPSATTMTVFVSFVAKTETKEFKIEWAGKTTQTR